MADPDSRAWWQKGVLGRLETRAAGDLSPTLALLADGEAGLGLDGVVLDPTSLDDHGTVLARGRALGLRILVELPVQNDDGAAGLAADARAWLENGADGISIELLHPPAPEPPNVTPLTETTPETVSPPPDVTDAIREVVDAYPGRLLVGHRTGAPGAYPPGPHLVIEKALDRRPWRAASFRLAIEEAQDALPSDAWPGYAMGAPRRGPFAVGLPMEDSLACAAALHLTLRGTPWVELGPETGLPEHAARRVWYRRLIDLRRREPALHGGGLRLIAQPKAVLGYLREREADRIAVLLNLSRRTRSAHLPTGFGWTVLLGVGPSTGARLAGGDLTLPGCGVLIARSGAPLSRSLGTGGQRRATGR